ncbi:hypothetical protein HK100_002523 [Physocladia obscura]|uniref:Uncharacterized protein n=1 Tax=Physocladia obscura TaxID=109957 RepID=A0AAD5XJH5_9FUNG|nr:hypothetical protein HK100_002523 [Physocladia obscura]
MSRSAIPSIVIESGDWVTSNSAESFSVYSKLDAPKRTSEWEGAGGSFSLSSRLAAQKRASLWEIAGSLWDKASSLWEISPRKRQMQHKIKQYSVDHWGDLFRVSYSVLPSVFLPSIALAAWSTLVCIFYLVPHVNFLQTYGLPNSTLLVTVLGTVMSLLLVFRVNTAYDRFWEGRKLWSTLHFQLRNLARFFWIFAPCETPEDFTRKTNAMNLLIAFAASTKHSLRDEPSHKYIDLGPYLEHIPKYSANAPRIVGGLPIPLEIALHFQKFVDKDCKAVWLLASQAISALADTVTSAHRIKDTPIPAAYRIHLKQTLILYLLSLPFQLVASPLGWFTILIVFFIAMMTLGIEVIGAWIENPFGYDASDLPQDEFCDAIAAEITQIMHSQDRYGAYSKPWLTPCSLEIQRVDLEQLCEVTRTTMAVRHRATSPTETLTNNDAELVPVEGMAAKLVGLRPVASQETIKEKMTERSSTESATTWAISKSGSLFSSIPQPHNGCESDNAWEECTRKARLQHKVSQFKYESYVSGHIFYSSRVVHTVQSIGVMFSVFRTRTALALPNAAILVNVMGTVMSLLLVFRVNSAYDRFWEGRKLWTTIHFQLRNLGRFFWIYASSESHEDLIKKKNAMNLLIAFAAATKHMLRDEKSHKYRDLGPFLEHIPKFILTAEHTASALSIPNEINLHLQHFVNNNCKNVWLPASQSISVLGDSLTSLQRIKETPIPVAYRIHLKQSLAIYLLSLPFQLVPSSLQWFTIPYVFFTALIMLGIEVIGDWIENPFGYDANDLPQDEFCDAIKEEIQQIMSLNDIKIQGWVTPHTLGIKSLLQSKFQGESRTALPVESQVVETNRGYAPLISMEGVIAQNYMAVTTEADAE